MLDNLKLFFAFFIYVFLSCFPNFFFINAQFTSPSVTSTLKLLKRKIVSIEFSKPWELNLRSKSAAKRRKIEDVIDLDDSFDYDRVTKQTSKWVHEKLKLIEDMQKLAHARLAATEKDDAEIVKLRKEVKDLKVTISKKSAEVEIRIMREKDTLLIEIKRDATISVLEARI